MTDIYLLANCISNLPCFSVLILHLFETFPVEVFHIPHLYPWDCEWNSGNWREKSNIWQGDWGQEFGCCVGNKSNQQWIKKKYYFIWGVSKMLVRIQKYSFFYNCKPFIMTNNIRFKWKNTSILTENWYVRNEPAESILKLHYASNIKRKYNQERVEEIRL